jgi:lipopolysaccharide biosynthesis glycosyltransferase
VGKWGSLDPRWNFNANSSYDYTSKSYQPWKNTESFLPEDVYNRLVSKPYIIHFAMEGKPWVSRECPYREDFFEYVDKTKWRGWRISILRRLWRKLFPTRKRSIDWL